MNMLATIVPKSEQLNADDLIGRTLTIKVTNVSVLAGGEQPCAINFEGDGGKPYKPGKSMRRVLVAIWGPDAKAYIGKSMTLYRDEKVTFGGLVVGGIRISHMTGLDEDRTLALAVTKGAKKAFVVRPLRMQQPAPAAWTADQARAWATTQREKLPKLARPDTLAKWLKHDDTR